MKLHRPRAVGGQAGDALAAATGGTIGSEGATAADLGGSVFVSGGFVSGGIGSGGTLSIAGTLSIGGTVVALPPEKTLESLNGDEVARLREETNSLIQEQLTAIPLEVRCHYRAVVQGSVVAGAGARGTSDDVREACAVGESYCIEASITPDVDSRSLHPSDFEGEDSFRECSATVSDYLTCTSDLVQTRAGVMAELPPCDELDVSYYQGAFGVPVKEVEPSSCSMLYSECWRLHRYGDER